MIFVSGIEAKSHSEIDNTGLEGFPSGADVLLFWILKAVADFY